MKVVIAMALFGSGTHFPIGVFDSTERANEEIARVKPSASFLIETELNTNMEIQIRESRKKRSKEWRLSGSLDASLGHDRPSWTEFQKENAEAGDKVFQQDYEDYLQGFNSAEKED